MTNVELRLVELQAELTKAHSESERHRRKLAWQIEQTKIFQTLYEKEMAKVDAYEKEMAKVDALEDALERSATEMGNRITKLQELLEECSSALAAELEGRYGYLRQIRDQRNFEHGLKTIHRARAALGEEGITELKTGGNSGAWNEVHSGDAVVCLTNGRTGILRECLQDGDASVDWDDGRPGLVKWLQLAPRDKVKE